MQYRREIDGLRAIAVIPVILFHAGFSAFGGGFVGVDVFFVISGYLITSLLIAELEQGRFSILRFYERRARRILPALFFVILCCIPFAWLWMMPLQFVEFSRSLVAVALFASNVLFWREDGYFATSAELKPLLHTWSLAVEEQFYLLFPVMLAVLWRLGRGWAAWIVAGTAAVSFVLCELVREAHTSAAFYLAPFRAWELLAGSLCAFAGAGRERRANGSLGLLGLALILGAVAAFDEATPFPGAYALVPVAGTVLVILYAGPATWVGRQLGRRAVVGMGLISYSAYLWHQPLFAFARLRSVTQPDPRMMALLAVASVGLAVLSWRFVEQPFRERPVRLLPRRGSLFDASGAMAAGVAMFGVAGVLSEGMTWRIPAPALAWAKWDSHGRNGRGATPWTNAPSSATARSPSTPRPGASTGTPPGPSTCS